MPVLRQRLLKGASGAALPLLVAACMDQPLASGRPSASAAAATRTGAEPGPPPLVRNASRYREQGYAHATGRSGSASLRARALLGRDGRTELVVTTGPLDEEPAPGTIAKLQVRLLEGDGALLQTLSYPHLDGGGTVVRVYEGLPRHGWFRVQANVRGIDPRRTDVVTVSERVSLRPDLAVAELRAPEAARVNTHVAIQATLAELNGDVGATTACVLYVDGARVDRAEGVWVAEGDAVTCAFSHRFQQAGPHTVAVAAEDVRPGDWDPANNRQATTIQVATPQVPLHGYAYAWENSRETHERLTYRWRSVDGSFTTRESSLDSTTVSQGMTMSGLALHLLSPSTARFDVSIRGGERTLFAYAGPPSWRTRTAEGDCVGHSDGPATVQACTRAWGGTEVVVSRYAGRAVYFSHGASEVYRAWDGYYYHQSWSDATPGQPAAADEPLAEVVSFDVRVDDGLAVYTATPSVGLAPSTQAWGSPVPACRPYADPWMSTESCSARWGSYVARSGWSYF